MTNLPKTMTHNPMKLPLIVLVTFLALRSPAGLQAANDYSVKASGIKVALDANGEMTACVVGKQRLVWPLHTATRLAGCRTEGKTIVKDSGGGWEFVRRLVDDSGHGCTLTERFLPTASSIRWEVEIVGAGKPWSTTIETALQTMPRDVSFWAPWGDPRGTGVAALKNEAQIANAIAPSRSGLRPDWTDPLVAQPLCDGTWWYGAPYFRYDSPRIAFCPFQGDLLCIPMASLLRESDDTGLSLVLSPEDPLLDLTLRTTSSGELVFNRLFLRISNKSPVRFAADLAPHESDWRGGLRWITRRYRQYFDPPNPVADDLAGTGAYATQDAPFDVAKMKRMAFRTNWNATFDFPYLGMYLPPVGAAERWTRFSGGTTSIPAMRDYAKRMRADGFHVLSYFNVADFGTKVQYPAPPRRATDDRDLWKDCNDFIYGKLAAAILRVPARVAPEKLRFYPRTQIGGPYFTWRDGIVLDCGERVFREFLLDQAQRLIQELPDADGICIDRLDWLRMYNEDRDDGQSWFEGKPVRALLNSWRGLMDQLGPLMHGAGKVVFVNNHVKRVDVLRQVDGIFDEFTYAGSPLNTTALLCLRKPALGWTASARHIAPDPDQFFQRHLHMGVYPMAPFPGNDHALRPSPEVDRHYLDYGPLLDAMRGKKWVLEPHCAATTTPGVKVNLFRVPGGYVLPVTFGDKYKSAVVRVRNVSGLEKARCDALHPAVATPQPVAAIFKNGVLEIHAILHRGCAVIRIDTK